ncbi:MAG: hypothetical protein HY000_12780, partial [Planctomycetes bacterium]|nr:hypothetical protein [Planctomycetota bacterium]
SVLRDVSQTPRLRAACERLAAVGVRILGAVVSGISHDQAYAYHYQKAMEPEEVAQNGEAV